MTANGQNTTIVVIDWGAHAARVVNLCIDTAPGAITCSNPATHSNLGYIEADVREELEEIIRCPGNVRAVVMPWGVPGWSEEFPPAWTNQPGRGFEPQFAKLREKGIYIIASAGDDREHTGDRLGANYPACSPHVIPAMGAAEICNRTQRGYLVRETISSSLAAGYLGACIAILRSAGVQNVDDVLMENADFVHDKLLGALPAVNISKALKSVGAERGSSEPTRFTIKPQTSGRMVVEAAKITRYKASGAVHWEKQGSGEVTLEAGKAVELDVVGDAMFRRVA